MEVILTKKACIIYLDTFLLVLNFHFVIYDICAVILPFSIISYFAKAASESNLCVHSMASCFFGMFLKRDEMLSTPAIMACVNTT